MVKFGKTKSAGRGPSSSLGLLSFSDARKSLVKLTPEFVLILALVVGLVVLVIQFL